MPSDFMNGNNANSGRSMSLNLDALGEAANQSVNMSNGEKPVLNQEVEATITLTDLRLMNQLQSNQNDPSKKYFNTIFIVETEFVYKDSEGNDVNGTSRDNYGGLRYFVNLDEQGNVIRDATGQPILERLWSGDGSAFGRLFTAVQEKDSSVRSYSDFFNFFKKGDVKVILKTETTNYQGKQHHKNIIQRIL